jgi:cobalt-zinc-cadmium efflux system protein
VTHGHGDAGRALAGALGLVVLLMTAELVTGLVTGSLVLLADAGHLLADAGALGAAIWAGYLARRPPTAAWTFGLPRAEILSAAGNGVLLAVAAGLVTVDAVRRLVHPPTVAGVPVAVVAGVGILVNLSATALVGRADRTSLNIRGALMHLVTDLYAFTATLAAGLVLVTTGFRRADSIASLVVAVLMVRAAWQLIGASGRVLLEGAPREVDLTEVRRHLAAVPEVIAVHDLHAWTLTSSRPVLSAHVVVDQQCLSDGRSAQVLDRLQQCLAGHFDVAHSTFQLEPASHVDHERPEHG